MLSAMDDRKPTPEEIKAAKDELEAEIEKVGQGADPERMKRKAADFERLLKRSKGEDDA